MLQNDEIRIEHQRNCMTDKGNPRISFSLSSDQRSVSLAEAEIEVNGWNCRTNQQTGIVYAGRALEPFSRYCVRIKARDNHGESACGETFFETGRMGRKWKAEWISDTSYSFENGESPVPYVFYRKFKCKKEIKRAFVTSAALGIYEMQLNGEKVGREYFAPGFTSYAHTLQYNIYDLPMLKRGMNEIIVTVGGGWAVGRSTYIYDTNQSFSRISSKYPALLMEIWIEYADGSRHRICTDENWRVSQEGPCRFGDFYDGEIYDARTEYAKIQWKQAAKYGLATDEFYHYVQKMKEWYEAGYIYTDFASRTNDMFYLPNTSLTYGGAAGVWFGLTAQLGTQLSLPEYGLNVQVEGISAPLDTEHGITEEDASFMVYSGAASMPWCISTVCDESKYARIFSLLDYLFTEEGSLLKKHGLNAEQAAGNELYAQYGLEDGTYYLDEDGGFYSNEVFYDTESSLDRGSFVGNLLPGLDRADADFLNDPDTENKEAKERGAEAWSAYGKDRNYPSGASMNTEESESFNAVYTNITDYVNSMIPKFIMGTEELTKESWSKYVDQVYALGLEQALEAERSALGRYQSR